MSEEEKKQYGLPEADSLDIEELKARIAKRKEDQLLKKKRQKRRLIIILSSVVIAVGLIIFSLSSFFAVDLIEVRGNSYFTSEEIINMAHATPGKNLIYHTDSSDIISYLEQNPYIKSASVSRQLPSTLVITVKERTEIGAIVYDGDYLIIDNTGLLLRKTSTTPKLTIIEGLVVSKIKSGEKIEVEDEELLQQTLKILRTMNSSDLYFVRLDMSEMYIKAYIYETLLCKGTYSQMIDGMEKGRLHKVLEKLFEDGIKRGTITFSDEGYASFQPTM